ARREGVSARDRPSCRRDDPGHLRGPSSLLLRRRQQGWPDSLPERLGVRRAMARRAGERRASSMSAGPAAATPRKLEPPRLFPDLALADHTGRPRTLSELANGDPLAL